MNPFAQFLGLLNTQSNTLGTMLSGAVGQPAPPKAEEAYVGLVNNAQGNQNLNQLAPDSQTPPPPTQQGNPPPVGGLSYSNPLQQQYGFGMRNSPYTAASQKATPQTQESPNAPLPQSTVDPVQGRSGQGTVPSGIAGQMYGVFAEEGWAPHIIYGALGNFQQESGFNPLAFNKGEGAFGVAQWRHDRLDNLRKFAGQNNMSVNDPITQAKFVVHEMKTTERGAYDRLMRARTVEEATAIFDQYYERSSGAHRKQRISAALNFANGMGLDVGDYTEGQGYLPTGRVSTMGGTYSGPNPFNNQSNPSPEPWEPKNWKEKILGVKPKDENDDSGGARQYRKSGSMFVGLGQGLAQMSHGQPVDISQSFEQFRARQQEVLQRKMQIEEKEQQRTENATLFESLDDDLKPIAQSQKGLDAALQVMTARMKESTGQPLDAATIAALPEEVRALAASGNEQAVKTALETGGNIIQDQAKVRDGGAGATDQATMLANWEAIPAEDKAKIIADAERTSPALADGMRNNIPTAITQYYQSQGANAEFGVGRARPEEIAQMDGTIDQYFPPDQFPKENAALKQQARTGEAGFKSAGEAVSNQITKVLSGQTSSQDKLRTLFAGDPASLAILDSDKGVETILAGGPELIDKRMQQVAASNSVEQKIAAINDYGKAMGYSENWAADMGVNPTDRASVEQGLNAMHTDMNRQLQGLTDQRTTERRIAAETEAANIKMRDEQIFKDSVDKVKWDQLNAAMTAAGVPEDKQAALRMLDPDRAKDEVAKMVGRGIEFDQQAIQKAEQNAEQAAAYADAYGSEIPEIGRVAAKSPEVAQDMVDNHNERKKVEQGIQDKRRADAALADAYAKDPRLTPEQRLSIATIARNGDPDAAAKAYLDATGKTPDQLNFEYAQNLTDPEQRTAFVGQIATSRGLQSKQSELALTNRAKQLQEDATKLSGAPALITKLELALDVMSTGDVGTGLVTSTMMPALSVLDDLGIHVRENMPLTELFNSVSKSMVSDFRVSGEGTMTDSDAKRFESIIPSLSKSEGGNAVVAQTLINMNKRDLAILDAKNEYFYDNGVSNPEGLDKFIESSLRERGLDAPLYFIMDQQEAATPEGLAKVNALPAGYQFILLDANKQPIIRTR